MSDAALVLDEVLTAAGPRRGRCGWGGTPSASPAVAAAIRPVCTVAAVPSGLRRTGLARLAAEREFLRVVPLPDAATVALAQRPHVDHAELARARRWCGGRVTPDAAAAWWAAEMETG